MCYCLFLSSCLIPSPVSLSMVYGQEGFEPNTPRSVLQHYNAMLALRKQWLYSRKFSDNVLENLKNNLAILFLKMSINWELFYDWKIQSKIWCHLIASLGFL